MIDVDLPTVPLLLLLLVADGFAERPEELPPSIPNVTRALVFGTVSPPHLSDLDAEAPPLASDVARAYAFDAPAAPRKAYDPAPLWLDRLAEAFGARPNYLVREPKVELASCDASDMRSQQFHDDHARVDATNAAPAITASAVGTVLGLMLGGNDRPLAEGVRLRGKARSVGLVGEW